MAVPSSLKRKISPPPTRSASTVKTSPVNGEDELTSLSAPRPGLAAIEAGEAEVQDHLIYFSEELRRRKRPRLQSQSQLSIDSFQSLYRRNKQPNGRHFVVHQHDHPVAGRSCLSRLVQGSLMTEVGVHYDLRLQISESSSISFSIPYGLPGNPNSMRPNRMAIETRVHNLWVGGRLLCPMSMFLNLSHSFSIFRLTK